MLGNPWGAGQRWTWIRYPLQHQFPDILFVYNPFPEKNIKHPTEKPRFSIGSRHFWGPRGVYLIWWWDDLTSGLSQSLSFGNWEGKSATFGSKNGSRSLAPGGDPLHPFFGQRNGQCCGRFSASWFHFQVLFGCCQTPAFSSHLLKHLFFMGSRISGMGWAMPQLRPTAYLHYPRYPSLSLEAPLTSAAPNLWDPPSVWPDLRSWDHIPRSPLLKDSDGT